MGEPPDGLTIGELAERSGVAAATLRSWEARHGFPRPQRRAGGHRRYDEQDLALIAEVGQLRAAGMSLAAAIRQVSARGPAAEDSVFAGLRRRHPGLSAQVLRKTTLLALTRAVEDECCARAERPLLFASFQHGHYYRRAQARWEDLARTSQLVVVFADFGALGADLPEPGSGPPDSGLPGPVLVPIPAGQPLRREWVLVCGSPGYPACVAGWELPGQSAASGADRRFEVLWTVDPAVVHDAAVICAGLAAALVPGLSWLPGSVASFQPPAASADLQRATGLLNRTTAYLEEATAADRIRPRTS